MESIGLQVGLLLAVIFLLERLASTRGWTGVSIGGVPVLTWFVLTAMALWLEGVAAFVVVHLLLFTLGTGAATAGVLVTALLLAGTPFATAFVLRRGSRHPTLHA